MTMPRLVRFSTALALALVAAVSPSVARAQAPIKIGLVQDGEWLAPAGAEDAATAIAHGQG